MDNSEILRHLTCDRGGCLCVGAANRGKGLVHCPAHSDNNPSLSVTLEGDKLLFNCKAGCSQEAVIEALKERGWWREKGSGQADILPLRQRSSRTGTVQQRVTATFQYVDAAGILAYEVRRFEPGRGDRAKEFRPFTPNGDGNLHAGLSESVPRILYRLPQMLAELKEKPGRWVLLPEGEKDAERLAREGFCSTAYMGGVQAKLPDLEPLRGERVALLGDADEPGVKRCERDAKALWGIAREIKILMPPNVEITPNHGVDFSDLFDRGYTHEELANLIREAPLWSPFQGLTLRSVATTPKTWFLGFPDIGEVTLTSEQLMSWRRVAVICLELRGRHPEYRPRNQANWEDTVIMLTAAAPEAEPAEGYTGDDELLDLVVGFLANARMQKEELGRSGSPFAWRDQDGRRIVFRLKQLRGYLRMHAPQSGKVDQPQLHRVVHGRLLGTRIDSFRVKSSVFPVIEISFDHLPDEVTRPDEAEGEEASDAEA